jgi:hypothetical protein
MEVKKLSVDELLLIESQKNVDRMISNILLFVIAAIPLIVRTAIVQHTSPIITGTILDSGVKGDTFTYYKFVWLGIITIFLCCVFLYKMLVKGYIIPRSYINIPALVMFVFIALSSIFSEYKSLSFFGQYNRHDGALTYLFYLTLFFIAANIVYDTKKLKMIIYFLSWIILFNALFGVLSFYGVNLMQVSVIKALLLPPGVGENAIQAGSYFASTINNPNYVSGIGGVLTVIFITKAVLSKEKKEQFFSSLLAIIAFAMLLTAMSTSGFLTLVVMLPVIIIFAFLSTARKRAFAVFATLLVGFSAVFAVLNSHNHKIWDESVGFFMGSSEKKLSLQEDTSPEKITVHKFLSNHSPFSVSTVYAESQQPSGNEFNLPPAGWGAGTGRIYIWEKTIELIKERPFLGYGLDTLAYYFPQDDPAKNSNLNDANTIVDKPHNMYLGIAYGSGMLTLISFVWLIINHLVANIKVFKQRKSKENFFILAVLFTGWCAYLIQALFNDSIIGTAPIFWVLFGVSVAIIREELEVIGE